MLIQLLSACYGHDNCWYAEVESMIELIDCFWVSISDMEDVALDDINWKDFKSVGRAVGEAVIYNVFSEMKDNWSVNVYLPWEDWYLWFHFKARNREVYDEMVKWLRDNHSQEIVHKFLFRFTRENGKD